MKNGLKGVTDATVFCKSMKKGGPAPMIQSMKKMQLPIIEKVRNAANVQYTSGEITYLEWTMAMHQTMTIQTQYLQLLQTYHELTNTINYLQQQ